MHVLAEVVEVQAQRTQFGEVKIHLLANPYGAVDKPYAFARFAEPQSIGFATQKRSRFDMVAVRERHVLMLGTLAIEERHLELFPGLVRAVLSRRQRLALLATATTLGFDVVAAFHFLGLRDDGNHYAVAARVNAGFLPCFVFGHDAIAGVPGDLDVVVFLRFQDLSSGRFHESCRSCSPLIFTCAVRSNAAAARRKLVADKFTREAISTTPGVTVSRLRLTISSAGAMLPTPLPYHQRRRISISPLMVRTELACFPLFSSRFPVVG